MAHDCPECYAICHCGGDIDDICWGDASPEAFACKHCPWDGEPDDFYDYLEDDRTPELAPAPAGEEG
jgi:hypothetical protein